MRIRDKTQCGNMSDEAIGESKKKDINHRSPNNKTHPSPNCSAEPEITPLLSGKIKVCRGLKNENNSHDGEKDVLSAPSSPNLCSDDPHTSGGGRLKFFKDGKFILELSHRKDGEKTCWIPVPKKTFWPVIGSPKQESLASLSDEDSDGTIGLTLHNIISQTQTRIMQHKEFTSQIPDPSIKSSIVSDDNSSVQSSPWQRDHCWKQTTPKHNINKQKGFYFFGGKASNSSLARTRLLGRKPFTSVLPTETLSETASSKSQNRLPLGRILQSLWERVMTTSCKPDLGIVSPRKRILRELERFTLEEATKRQRARAPLRSSHSISSILAKEGDSVLRTLLRSPSPETARPPLMVTTSTTSSSSSTSYHPPSTHNVQHNNSFLGNSNNYYNHVATYPPPMWPVHDPFSSPPLPFPSYYIPSYTQSWPQVHRPVPSESSSDVPLNLSKNPG